MHAAWSFSQLLEPLAIIPQLLVFRRCTDAGRLACEYRNVLSSFVVDRGNRIPGDEHYRRKNARTGKCRLPVSTTCRRTQFKYNFSAIRFRPRKLYLLQAVGIVWDFSHPAPRRRRLRSTSAETSMHDQRRGLRLPASRLSRPLRSQLDMEVPHGALVYTPSPCVLLGCRPGRVVPDIRRRPNRKV